MSCVWEAITPEKRTYSQIFRTSALIGTSSVLNIAIGIVGTKAMAVLLGPAGFGLMALYNSIADLAQNIASMGINSSGVRQIAAAVGSGDTEQIARTAVVLRRTSIILGAARRYLAYRIFRTCVHLHFWQPSTCYCDNLTFGRGAVPLCLRRSRGVDPRHETHIGSRQDERIGCAFRHDHQHPDQSIFFAKTG